MGCLYFLRSFLKYLSHLQNQVLVYTIGQSHQLFLSLFFLYNFSNILLNNIVRNFKLLFIYFIFYFFSLLFIFRNRNLSTKALFLHQMLPTLYVCSLFGTMYIVYFIHFFVRVLISLRS